MATDAIDQYEEVLKRQPGSIESVKGIAQIYMQLRKFEDARSYYQRAIAMNPRDPGVYYSLAVMDWMDVYRALHEQRAKMNFKTTRTLIFDPMCRELRAKHLPMIQEGMDMLTKSMTLRADYDDAMVYMDLLYRTGADLDCARAKNTSSR